MALPNLSRVFPSNDLRCAVSRAGLLDRAPRPTGCGALCSHKIARVARFLVVGEGERSSALVAALEREGHVVDTAGQERPLGELLAALDYVTIVCWLSAEVSPERFLLRAIDSSVRGFLVQVADWEPAVSETAARNSIPLASVRADPRDVSVWVSEARAAIGELLAGARG